MVSLRDASPESSEDQEWEQLAAAEFGQGYADSDAIYDQLSTRRSGPGVPISGPLLATVLPCLTSSSRNGTRLRRQSPPRSEAPGLSRFVWPIRANCFADRPPSVQALQSFWRGPARIR